MESIPIRGEYVLTTINEIAQAAGVGVGTVSRYLNKKPHVSVEKGKKIQRAIEQLQYTPSAIATQLRAKSTKNIGFLVSRLSNPFFAELFDHVATLLDAKGYQVFVAQTHEDPHVERRFLQQLKTGQVDRIIMASVEDPQQVEEIAQDYPHDIILLNETISGAHLNGVSLDHYQATLDALNYLSQQGHQRIAYVTGGEFPSQRHGRSRTQAYQDFLTAHQQQQHTDWIFSQKHTIADGQQVGRDLAKLPVTHRPEAVFTNSDEVAVGLIAGLKENQIKVPNEIAVVGYDDQPLAAYVDVPLTTVRQPISAMAQQAVDLVLDQKTTVTAEDLALKLIIRKSA